MTNITDKARNIGDKAAEVSRQSTDNHPLALLAGGLALGALIGAMLPKTERERKLVGTKGRGVTDRAKRAIDAARDVGTSKIKELGSSKEIFKSQVKDMVSKSGEAAKAAALAAKDAATRRLDD